jgi:Flp pilus assembly pilin Flp
MRQDQGASAVEYGLMLFAVAAAIAAIVFSFGGMVGDIFSSHSSCFSSHVNDPAASC